MTSYGTLSYVESYQVKKHLPILRKTGVTMVTSGFGPYHGLWLDDPPTKRVGVTPTPWTMTLALGFAEILQAHE